MVTAYRIQKEKYNKETLLGRGAEKSGGRWNPIGVALVYTSITTSLAVLELQPHIDKTQIHSLPKLNFAVLEIPEECIHEFEIGELPIGWDSIPSTSVAEQFLAPYLASKHSLVYKVPSAVNHYETNLLIDPNHPDIGRIVEKTYLDFSLDKRVYGIA